MLSGPLIAYTLGGGAFSGVGLWLTRKEPIDTKIKAAFIGAAVGVLLVAAL